MSESILLIVPSMDGLHANPMYVRRPERVCVCCKSLLWTERRAFQEKCSTHNERLATECSLLYSQPALLSNPLSNVKWIMIWALSLSSLSHTHILQEQISSSEIKEKKKYMSDRGKDCFAYENPVLGASSLFQSTAAGEVCLHLASALRLAGWVPGRTESESSKRRGGETGVF